MRCDYCQRQDSEPPECASCGAPMERRMQRIRPTAYGITVVTDATYTMHDFVGDIRDFSKDAMAQLPHKANA